MPDSVLDVVVVGTGITGLTAARSAVRAGLATATIDPQLCGGLVMNINELDGEPHGSGMDLASTLMMELSELGVTSLSERVTALSRDGDFLDVVTDAGIHHARSVIVASGARLKQLNIPGEAEFDHRGVSQCADCDGPLFHGEAVVVVGGGDSALQEALVLSDHCSQVYLVHRRAGLRAQPHLMDAVRARQNIIPRWNTVAEEVLGDQTVTGVRVRDLLTDQTSEIRCSGVFVYIGLLPNSEFVPGEIGRDANGFLVTSGSLTTAMGGVLAAGAVRAGYGGMLSHAIDEGEKAAQTVRAMIRA